MDTFTVISPASGALVRADFSPRIETALVPNMSSSIRRLPVLAMPTNRLGTKNSSVAENGVNTALSSLLQLPPGTNVQVSVTSESNRYDKLKYAAEEMIREQISTKTERDLSTSKTAALEATVQAQSAKIQKLRTDKSQLLSLLELEKSAISKLEFENKSLQTLLEGLKSQVNSFEAHVKHSQQDSADVKLQLEQYNSLVGGLENRIRTTIDQYETKQLECDALREKIDRFEAESREVQCSLESEISALRSDLSISNQKIEEQELYRNSLEQQLHKTAEELLDILEARQRLEREVSDLEALRDEHKAKLEQSGVDLTESKALAVAMEEQFSEACSKLNLRISELESTRDGLMSEVKTREADVVVLEEAIELVKERLKAETDEKLELQTVLDENQKRLAMAQETRLEMEQQMQEVRDTLNQCRQQNKESIDGMAEQLERKDIEIQESKAEILELVQQLQATSCSTETLKEEHAKVIATHKAELAELKRSMLGMVAEREEQMKKLKNQLSQLQNDTHSSASSLQAQLTETENALEEAQATGKALSDEMAKTAKKLKSEISRRETLEETLKTTKSELAVAKKESKALRSESDNRAAELEKSVFEANAEKTALECRLQESVDYQTRELASLKQNLTQLTNEKKVVERHLTEERKKIEKLEKQVSDLQSRSTTITSMKKTVSATEKEKREVEEKLAQSEKQVGELESKIGELELRLDAAEGVKKDLAVLESEKDSLSRSAAEKAKLATELEAKVDQLQSRHSAELKAAKHDTAQVQSEKEDLEKEVAEGAKKVAELKKQVSELQSKLAAAARVETPAKIAKDGNSKAESTSNTKKNEGGPNLTSRTTVTSPKLQPKATSKVLTGNDTGEEEDYDSPSQKPKVLPISRPTVSSTLPKPKPNLTAIGDKFEEEDSATSQLPAKAPISKTSLPKAPVAQKQVDTPMPKKTLSKTVTSSLPSTVPSIGSSQTPTKNNGLNWGAKAKTSPPQQPDPKSAEGIPASPKVSPKTLLGAKKVSLPTSTVPLAKKSPELDKTATNKPKTKVTATKPAVAAPKTTKVAKTGASKFAASDSMFDHDDDPFVFK